MLFFCKTKLDEGPLGVKNITFKSLLNKQQRRFILYNSIQSFLWSFNSEFYTGCYKIIQTKPPHEIPDMKIRNKVCIYHRGCANASFLRYRLLNELQILIFKIPLTVEPRRHSTLKALRSALSKNTYSKMHILQWMRRRASSKKVGDFQTFSGVNNGSKYARVRLFVWVKMVDIITTI